MCVPICGESIDCLDEILAECVQQNVLIVAVVNQPQTHPQTTLWQQQNQALMSHWEAQAQACVLIQYGMCLLTYASGMSCVVIDRSSTHPIPTKQGVGLARKIAADVALRFIHEGWVKAPWIYSTDADVRLPAEYFQITQTYSDTQVTAVCLPFQHCGDDQPWSIQQQLYDMKLYYYQAGIRFADAAYDYIPLGSTVVVSAMAYAQVRGFPVRNGAEDFYILNKLAKLGKIEQPEEPLILIQSRLSDRVPFGTGPAVAALMQQADAVAQPLYYHPVCFHYLKQWQHYLRDYWHYRQPPEDAFIGAVAKYFDLHSVLDKSLPHIRTEERWYQFVHEWLDAFRLLKSVHFFSETWPLLNLQQLLTFEEFRHIDKYGSLLQQAQGILSQSNK